FATSQNPQPSSQSHFSASRPSQRSAMAASEDAQSGRYTVSNDPPTTAPIGSVPLGGIVHAGASVQAPPPRAAASSGIQTIATRTRRRCCKALLRIEEVALRGREDRSHRALGEAAVGAHAIDVGDRERLNGGIGALDDGQETLLRRRAAVPCVMRELVEGDVA